MTSISKNWSVSRNELKFWVGFVILNSLLFLPWYLFSIDFSDFFPLDGFFSGNIYDGFKFIFIRYENYDIFRISVDLVLFCGLIYLTRHRKWVNYLIYGGSLVFVVLVIYQVYRAFFNIIYRIPAIFYNDYPMLKNGAKLIVQDFSFIHFLGGVIFLFVVCGLIYLFKLTFTHLLQVRFGNTSLVSIAIIGLLILVASIRYGRMRNIHYGIQLISPTILSNFRGSLLLKKEVESLNFENFQNSSKDYSFELDKLQPNVIVLFVESYGRLMQDTVSIKSEFKQLMNATTQDLKASGYHAMSVLSTAPVSGGGSWLSYTSAMLGYNINSQSLFFYLLKNNEFHQYQHFFRWLQNQGYYNYRLNSLFENENYNVPWDQYSSFYAVDEWIRFQDLQYEGKLYGYGPAPSDQYALNFSMEYINKESKGPYSLFFITKNSHNPFLVPHQVKKDWRKWNDEIGENEPSKFFQKPTIENYKKSQFYEINLITDMIKNSKGDNNLFLVIGDHQPPALNTNGFETPFHIISKDSLFLNRFEEYGLTKGMFPRHEGPYTNHAGIYSMLMREFKRNYSSDSTNLPSYLPNGLEF